MRRRAIPDHDVLHGLLRRFAHTMANPGDITAGLHALCDGVGDVFDSDGAGVALFDSAGLLRCKTASDARSQLAERAQEQLQSGPCLAAIASGRPVAVTDIRRCDQWPAYRDVTSRIGLSAMLAVPMALDGRTVGALDVYAADVRQWTDAQVRAAEVLADIAAAYVLNASELRRARRSAEQLQDALDSRVIIEQAKGRLAGELDISVDAAFAELRRFARRHSLKLRELAGEVAAHGLRAMAEVPASARL